MFVTVFYTVNPTFRDVEIPVIQKILHPEYYNGEFFSIDLGKYNPYFNYDYFAAFIARVFGYTENLLALGKIFWLFEKGFTILVLIILCNYIFKNDKTILAIAIMTFIAFLDCEATQKSMAMPLFILAIYYFLREKWGISALLNASVFYLHIGKAMWLVLTVFIAFVVIWYRGGKISLKQIISYFAIVSILASPIIFVYLGRTAYSNVDEFTVKYFYYTGLNATSVLLTSTVTPVYFLVQWIVFALFLLGYYKAKKEGCIINNIIPVIIGTVFLYIMQFIFADIFWNSTVITMQLMRAIIIAHIFGILFSAYLLANQIKKGNYVFFFLFVFMFFFYRRGIAFISLSIALIIYEIYEEYILNIVKKICKGVGKVVNTKEIKKRESNLLQYPVVIALCLLVLFILPKFSIAAPIKSYVKSILYRSSFIVGLNKAKNEKEAYDEVFKYINEDIKGKAVFLYPFNKWEFPIYTHHEGFINSFTPTCNLFYNNHPSPKFKYVLQNDLNYSIEKLFENRDGKNFDDRWDEMWEKLDEDIIKRWKERYMLTHVIRENSFPLKFPIIYQNSYYTVYEIE